MKVVGVVLGNGYARSEGIVAIFLQKHQESKRVYAQLIHSKNMLGRTQIVYILVLFN